MSWTHIRRRAYLPLLIVLVTLAIALVFALPESARFPAAIAIAIMAILPGYVARVLLRDLLASRAHLARGEHELGLQAARRFLSSLAERPWIRHAIWAQYGTYTLDVRAMAHNNEGAALLELARLREARLALQAARAADSEYPIPVYNLAIVAKLQGDEIMSGDLAREAVRLGFAGGRLDQAIMAIGETYARLAIPR